MDVFSHWYNSTAEQQSILTGKKALLTYANAINRNRIFLYVRKYKANCPFIPYHQQKAIFNDTKVHIELENKTKNDWQQNHVIRKFSKCFSYQNLVTLCDYSFTTQIANVSTLTSTLLMSTKKIINVSEYFIGRPLLRTWVIWQLSLCLEMCRWLRQLFAIVQLILAN